MGDCGRGPPDGRWTSAASYDEDIVSFLDAPVLSAFERDASGRFVPVAFPGDED